jgi:hypothetical protein
MHVFFVAFPRAECQRKRVTLRSRPTLHRTQLPCRSLPKQKTCTELNSRARIRNMHRTLLPCRRLPKQITCTELNSRAGIRNMHRTHLPCRRLQKYMACIELNSHAGDENMHRANEAQDKHYMATTNYYYYSTNLLSMHLRN